MARLPTNSGSVVGCYLAGSCPYAPGIKQPLSLLPSLLIACVLGARETQVTGVPPHAAHVINRIT